MFLRTFVIKTGSSQCNYTSSAGGFENAWCIYKKKTLRFNDDTASLFSPSPVVSSVNRKRVALCAIGGGGRAGQKNRESQSAVFHGWLNSK